ncbi:MAG TPA: hypothetical protein VFG32_01775 [Bacteroidota bacterium]|nr:hypothetical protein [Bacteroidota bacterium]
MVDVRDVLKALWWLTAALSLFLMSCASSTEFYRDVEEYVAQGKYAQAIEEVRKNESAYGDKSTVLYNLDLGLLYHYAGKSDSSTRHFFAAEKEIEDLYTKSVSLAALSFVLNDNILPYEGEDFEKVLINVFLALNYAEEGLADDALVEARKVDLKLREYAKQYEGKNKYQEDAFIRYIAGALYESSGELNDAFISYRKAYETYQTYTKEYGTPLPRFLLDDLVRTATLLSFTEEQDTYLALGGHEFKRRDLFNGSVLVVAYAGNGPIKIEQRPTVTIPDSSGTLHTFQVALPKFQPRYKGGRSYDVVVTSSKDSLRARTVVAENVTAIANKTLEDRLAMIYLKSGGRALLKFLAAEKAKSDLKKDSDSKVRNVLGSIAIDLFVGATEQADTRTWRILPGEIQLARIHLAPGKYTISIRSSDGGYEFREEIVAIRAGKTSFVIVDDVR